MEFTEGRNLMPRFPVPEGESEESWLVKEVERGLAHRFPNGVPQDRRDQAAYEVGVICQMGFPGYFLVTADLVAHAKSVGIRVGPGRGSAAGALIAYALGITELDPMSHGLLFERFLNPERVSMPDIDMDFDERRRSEMIRYATQRYGEERVAQIVTYSTIKAKAALKDSARVLGHPFAVGEKLTKAMPPAVMGKDIPLAGIFDPGHARYKEAADFRALYESEEELREVVDTARGLEGLRRQWGVHAAGVILSAEPLLDVIPIMRREQDGSIITQLDMGACESLGLLKMDFLGLRNLTILDDALRHIEANSGRKVVLEELTLDDVPTYELLARGDTLGVFQLDNSGMRALLTRLAPTNFEDISAVLALYRPGPMGANAHNDFADRKNGRQPVTPIHPELAEPLAEILGDTYGLIVYQEQVMAIAQKLAGYSLGSADLLRRAMGKKKKEILDKEYVPFAEGMRANGYSEAAIKTLWDILVPFSDYAFNKAHTAGYGLVSYWTAYLKANYPAEYMAGLLTSIADDKDKSAIYLNECRRMGIKVLPPDVNESQSDFAPVGTDIRFGLSAIRNVGANVVDSIIRTRTAKGRFADFGDFIAKVEIGVCNKRLVESLIKAGAFDSFGDTRKGLLAIHEQAIDAALDTKRAEAVGQFDLFAGHGRRGHRGRPGCPAGAPSDRVGQEDAAGLRARDARALRQRPPAVRPRARAELPGGHADLRARRRRAGRRADGHGRRAGHQRPAQDHQGQGRAVGDRHPRGPRRVSGGDVLPAALRDRGGAAGRGRRDRGPGPAGEGRRQRAASARHGHHGAEHQRRRGLRAGRHPPGHRTLHAAGGGSPARGPGQPPGDRRGAHPPAQRRHHHGPVDRRPVAGGALACPVRRPEGPARACLPGLNQRQDRRATGATRAPVNSTRWSGWSSTSSPRRPPETRIEAWASADSSTTVGWVWRCPSGEIPPAT